MFIPRILILIALLFITACDYMPKLDNVVTDRRNEYKKSEAMPDLEVPPDLTTDALNDPLAIPNEQVTTLSEFQRRKSMQTGGTATADGVEVFVNDQWLAMQGSPAEIWPKLREFWQSNGYSLELDDPELGVLETGWLETGSEGSTVFRDKFSLFTEAGTGGATVVFLSGERQEKIASADSSEWVSTGGDTELTKEMISEMNLYFYGSEAPAGTSSLTRNEPASSSTAAPAVRADTAPLAELLNLGDDKVYLSLPDEFTRAWVLTEDAIIKTGMSIENNDREKGIYYVLYFDNSGESEGLLSKLKFWGDDDSAKVYQLSLTGVGDKTELVVLDSQGEWAAREEASRILTYIQVQYNIAKSR